MLQNKKILVLVTDDYDDAAPMLAALVEHTTPFEAVWAKDGKDALDLALRRPPDIAILDIHMPHIGGIELAHALRTVFPHRVPVLIAATAGNTDAAIDSRMFDAVIRKPVDLVALVELLHRLTLAKAIDAGR
jgi:CheY-like chemotaxis protein